MKRSKDASQKFRRLLKTRGFKYTYERKRIFGEAQRLNRHFDADSLYERFKKRGERVSRATVYRTIPLLLEAGVIQKSAGSGKRDFFEKTSRKGHHDHMICVRCGKIIEFHHRQIETAQKELCRKHGFKLTFHDHRLFGYCASCR